MNNTLRQLHLIKTSGGCSSVKEFFSNVSTALGSVPSSVEEFFSDVSTALGSVPSTNKQKSDGNFTFVFSAFHHNFFFFSMFSALI